MNERILIMEDDEAILKLLNTNLKIAGYQTTCARDGEEALSSLQSQAFDIALLDIMVPKIDGFELFPFLQQKNIPVIFLSAKADVSSRVQGLKMGAEDYMVKPFDILELLVRIEKVLERHTPTQKTYALNNILLDDNSHTVTKNNVPISLKPMEYDLLKIFVKHPGMIFSRETLLKRVWGDAFIGETRTVDVHVASLRKKLDLNDNIVTVYKIGYRLEQKK